MKFLEYLAAHLATELGSTRAAAATALRNVAADCQKRFGIIIDAGFDSDLPEEIKPPAPAPEAEETKAPETVATEGTENTEGKTETEESNHEGTKDTKAEEPAKEVPAQWDELPAQETAEPPAQETKRPDFAPE